MARLYTRSGDGGRTRLADGSAVPKDDVRVEACGTLDELNAHIGVARSLLEHSDMDRFLAGVQSTIMELTAGIANPVDAGAGLAEGKIRALEEETDKADGCCPPLRSFVLPAGSSAACALQVARAVCRRAERAIVRLGTEGELPKNTLPFINRLSDLLFAYARWANVRAGAAEELWETPGKAAH